MKRITLTLILSLTMLSCATSPTGRKQLLLMSPAQLNQMGAAAFAQKKKSSKIEGARVTNRYVNCVANAVIGALPAQQQKGWEVVVFKDDSANAFALPGGKIGVHTGMLKIARTQDQLASVIGHEIGHVLAQHGNERMSIGMAAQVGQQVANVALNDGSKQAQMIMAAIGLGTQFGVQLPFSRAHESEADLMGQQLMARAGFNPQASVEVWQNMAKNSKGAPPEFMSTHPAHGTRIRELQSTMDAALKTYQLAGLSGIRPQCGRG